jgi:hypothetical protein
MTSLAQLEVAENRLVVLASRLAPCAALDQCNSLLSLLRKEKAALIAAYTARREAAAT